MVSPAASSPPTLLQTTVVEIEQHVARSGWDRPPTLFALVDTADLVRREPALARVLGLADPAGTPSLTPIEQEPLGDGPLDESLAAIAWPNEVLGCALAHEVLVLPPSAEQGGGPLPRTADWAATHPDRREVRMVVGVLRDGERASALRVRSAGGDPTPVDDVLVGTDLTPNLAEALLATLS